MRRGFGFLNFSVFHKAPPPPPKKIPASAKNAAGEGGRKGPLGGIGAGKKTKLIGLTKKDGKMLDLAGHFLWNEL